jgi:hypothetical protein
MNTIVAEYCNTIGYEVAGFAEEIYEDAHVCIVPNGFYAPFDFTKLIRGRVLNFTRSTNQHDPNTIYLVLELEESGVQTTLDFYGKTPVFFMLPEKVASLSL